LDEKQGSLRFLLYVQLAQRFRGGMVSPILALFIHGQGLTVSQIGLIGTAGMLGWFIFEPIAGVVADRVRKKYMVIFAIVFSSIVYAAYPLARGFWDFASLAFMMSSTLSFYAVSVKTLTAELLPSSGRGRTYGRYVSAISIGGILGPFLGGYLSDTVGHAVPFYLSAGLGILTIPVAVSMRYDERKVKGEPSIESSSAARNLWTRPFLGILIVRMLSMFNMVFVENTLPIFLHENPRTQASETQIGSYMGIIQLTSALSQVLLGSLNDKVGSRKIIVSSLFLTGLSYLGMVYVTGAIPLFILGGLQGIFFAAADLSMMIHLMSIMPEARTGVVMGVYSESENVGGMVAAPSLGLIYDSTGPAASVISVSAIIVANAFLSIPLIRARNHLRVKAETS